MAEVTVCIPYAHLEKFYAQVGFQKTDDLPKHIEERIDAYNAKGLNVIGMKRISS